MLSTETEGLMRTHLQKSKGKELEKLESDHNKVQLLLCDVGEQLWTLVNGRETSNSRVAFSCLTQLEHAVYDIYYDTLFYLLLEHINEIDKGEKE